MWLDMMQARRTYKTQMIVPPLIHAHRGTSSDAAQWSDSDPKLDLHVIDF